MGAAKEVAKKWGKKAFWKLVRVGGMTLAAPLTGGMSIVPMLMEVAMDVADVASLASDIADVSGIMDASADYMATRGKKGTLLDGVTDVVDALGDFHGEIDERYNMHWDFINNDGYIDAEEQRLLWEQDGDVIESFADLHGEIEQFSKSLMDQQQLQQAPTSSPTMAQAAISSVTGSLPGQTSAIGDGAAAAMESTVLAGFRQAQMFTAISTGLGLVAHAGTWYGLHALNMKIHQLENGMDARHQELQTQFTRDLQTLGTQLNHELEAIHTKLDQIHQKLNVMITSKLRGLTINAADATTGEELVSRISRGDIVECQETTIHLAEEALLTPQDWPQGTVYLALTLKAYELEFAWLVAKGGRRFIGLLPERLEEGARRLGDLLGRYVAVTGSRIILAGEEQERQEEMGCSSTLIFDSVTNLSNTYSRIFAPAATVSSAVTTTTEPEQELSPYYYCPDCSELFSAIGDMSMNSGDHYVQATQRGYYMALSFNPFSDASWLRLERSQGILSATPPQGKTALGGWNTTLVFIQKNAIDLQMSTFPNSPEVSQQEELDIRMQGLLMFAEMCELAQDLELPPNENLSLLLIVAKNLICSSTQLLGLSSAASYLLFGSLINLIPNVCLSKNTMWNREISAIFMATIEAVPFTKDNLALSFLQKMSEECKGPQFGLLTDSVFDKFSGSLSRLLERYKENESVLESVLEVYATITVGGEPVRNMLRAGWTGTTKPLTETTCFLLNHLKGDARIPAVKMLARELRVSCLDNNITANYAAKCCTLLQQIDSTYLFRHNEGLVYSLDDAQKRESRFIMDQSGRKQYNGQLCPSEYEPSLWEPCVEGNMVWDCGSVYEGQWENNSMNGRGELRIGHDMNDVVRSLTPYSEPGLVYRGMFKNGVFDGTGNISFPNHTYLVGTFKDGLCMHGNYTFSNGTVCLVQGMHGGLLAALGSCRAPSSVVSRMVDYGAEIASSLIKALPFSGIFFGFRDADHGEDRTEEDAMTMPTADAPKTRLEASGFSDMIPFSSKELKQALGVSKPQLTDHEDSSEGSPSGWYEGMWRWMGYE